MAKKILFLAVDIGNTNITFGVFSGGKLRVSARASTLLRTDDETAGMIAALLAQKKVAISSVSAAAVASVVPRVGATLSAALAGFGIPVTDIDDPGVRELVPVDYRPARSVGADRIANAAAAHALFHQRRHKIVVDFGTATTFDCVSPSGVYLGGVIHPGVEISAQSLFEKTAQLPQIGFSPVRSAVGKDTQGSIRAGLFYGIVGSVREIISQLECELGPTLRIGTGGIASLVCPAVGGFHAIDADLTLKGVRILYDLHREKTAPRPAPSRKRSRR